MTAPPPPGTRSILFVCTGNTCRSPLSEAIARRLLADRLGCEPGELLSKGFSVQSAGVMACPGEAASPHAVDAATELGAELGEHLSRPVNPELLASAELVVAMTRGHAMALQYRFPNCGPEPILLDEANDLPDPIGGPPEEYRACAGIIARNLDRLLTGWLGP